MKKLMMIALLSTLTLNCNPEHPCPNADRVTTNAQGVIIECEYDRYDIVDEIATPFNEGWEDGYKAGWCFERPLGCFEPFVPFAPFPKLGQDAYEDGYHRGFLQALKDRP